MRNSKGHPRHPGGQGMKRGRPLIIVLTAVIAALLLVEGCAPKWKSVQPYRGKPGYSQQAVTVVKKMGYTIQVGAFSKVENAARLTRALEAQELEAFYYAGKPGLYRVRFGNYPTLAKAQVDALRLSEKGVIGSYYIVSPSEYTISKGGMYAKGGEELRKALVSTAATYLGLPYQWGGSDPNGPVDCSGLVMAVYQLNGLFMPRTSEEQFLGGIPIEKNNLQKGDLVFFDTNGGGRVSHVGIYTGEGRFIHAPGTGKTVCEDSMSRSYFSDRFMGARTYLR